MIVLITGAKGREYGTARCWQCRVGGSEARCLFPEEAARETATFFLYGAGMRG